MPDDVKVAREDAAAIMQLFNAINYVVDEMEGPYAFKRGIILGIAKSDKRDRDNLMEFLSWFETPEDAA